MLTIKDDCQGQDENGRDFGYCYMAGYGGYFFTYCDTFRATLASIREDELEPVTKTWPKQAMEEMHEFIRSRWMARVAS